MTHKRIAFPAWMKKGVSHIDETAVGRILSEDGMNTVCREATCPNRSECYHAGTATFLIMGRVCTRHCRFCDITSGVPSPLDPGEPHRLADASVKMGLKYVVVTSVTRDDLPDGGASHFAQTIGALRARGISAIEVLIPDFRGSTEAIDAVIAAQPDVFNHNVETVPRLYSEVRPQANYDRSLEVLRRAAAAGLATKTGVMLGLGERPEEVLSLLHDLRWAGVSAITIGQYLAPSPMHHPVVEFIPPARFEYYADYAESLEIAAASGPFVRSSYRAEEMFARIRKEAR
ncbi:MAG: lipoyl synthase [Candidatus Brocadiia bacterium]